MFNLLVSGDEEAWNGEPQVFSAGRVVKEYTDPSLIQKYGDHSQASFDALKLYPCVFTYEQALNLPARLGWIKRVRAKDGNVRVEYEFDNSAPSFPVERLAALHWELDIGEWELNRTHWAVKNADIVKELHDSGVIDINAIRAAFPGSRLLPRPQPTSKGFYVNPSVFRIPRELSNPRLVSLMMPFDSGFRPVHEALREACADLDADCQRADEVWNENEVMQDVFSLIYRSKVIICDFSGRNANVFYEAGIAHTLGKPVIPIIQNPGDWPFDLQHHRFLRYLPNEQGIIDLKKAIKPRLLRLLAE